MLRSIEIEREQQLQRIGKLPSQELKQRLFDAHMVEQSYIKKATTSSCECKVKKYTEAKRKNQAKKHAPKVVSRKCRSPANTNSIALTRSTKRSNSWTHAVAQARRTLGIRGFHSLHKDTELYKLAKEIHSKAKHAQEE